MSISVAILLMSLLTYLLAQVFWGPAFPKTRQLEVQKLAMWAYTANQWKSCVYVIQA